VEELLEFKRRPDDKVLETMSLLESRCLRLQRKLARKVSRMGGNAVIGYNQVVDDEGLKSQRIVIRGYGTAILLDRDSDIQKLSNDLGRLLKVNPMKRQSTHDDAMFKLQKVEASSKPHTLADLDKLGMLDVPSSLDPPVIHEQKQFKKKTGEKKVTIND